MLSVAAPALGVQGPYFMVLIAGTVELEALGFRDLELEALSQFRIDTDNSIGVMIEEIDQISGKMP